MSDTSAGRTVVLCVECDGEALSEQCLLPDSYELVRMPEYAAAGRALRRTVFDAALLGADGHADEALALCAAVRRRDPHVPVVIYAKGPAAEFERDALAAGATRVLDTDLLTRGEIAHVFARCVADAELRNLAAVAAEIAAVREHLTEPRAPASFPRVLALEQYLASGGTRAGFHRSWTSACGPAGDDTLH